MGESDATDIQPILVDQEADSICFASNRPAKDKFDVDILVPASLKLHHTVYDIVDTLLSTDTLENPTIGQPEKRETAFQRSLLQPEPGNSSSPLLTKRKEGADDITVIFHDGSSPAEKQSVTNRFHETIQRLGTYDLSSFDTFFWTNPSTMDYFTRTVTAATEKGSSMQINDIVPYADRAALWTSSIQYLNRKVQADSQSGSLSDPCSLNTQPVTEKDVSVILYYFIRLYFTSSDFILFYFILFNSILFYFISSLYLILLHLFHFISFLSFSFLFFSFDFLFFLLFSLLYLQFYLSLFFLFLNKILSFFFYDSTE